MSKKIFAVIGILAIQLALLPGSVIAAPTVDDEPNFADRLDNRADPLGKEQQALHDKAIQAKLNGETHGKIHEVAKGQYVELVREGEDPIWTVLGEFSDLAHNEIPEPDRDYDNSTIWTADFNQDYYLNLLFDEGLGVNSMRQYYIEQSSNRYTVDGDVTDWVPVPGEAATYDDDFNSPLGGNQVWYFLRDSLDGWYQMQLDANKTPAEIDAYLSQFDVWDRYDWDGDGIFDEPDGYIDHMQFVHSGIGNESCSPACDDWAIWSHSWYAWYQLIGSVGPSSDYLLGGLQIGDSSYWIGDYTIQPENGGVGVFTHEYGHDLGLPDLYDYTGENSTGFWTLMSSGSNLGGDNPDIGSKPCHMGVWEKFQLGWLGGPGDSQGQYYEVAYAGTKSEHKLGPAETTTKQAQALFVVLPDKYYTVSSLPPEGTHFYYSGSGNSMDNFMYREFALEDDSTLTAKVMYNIEEGWDYAYLVVSTDNGQSWESVETNQSTTDDPNNQNLGFGITGFTGLNWVDLTADLSDYDGQIVLLGFRYWTDPYVAEPGFKVDQIVVSGYPMDGAESDMGWTYDPEEGGFRIEEGGEETFGPYFNAYVAEFRQYRGYDESLRYAYNFGFLDNPDLSDYVEHFPYQDGLLISYWDESFTNNNVGSHCEAGRCGGLLLTIDAHPDALYDAFGNVWRNRTQAYDSTFGLEPTEAITMHKNSQPSYHPSLPAVSVFDDRYSYYDLANPMGSVITPNTGTQIRVKSISAHNSFMQVEVRPAK